ncbi:MAG: hypothetical protein VW683_12945 [Betaproteobacteria bacterium]
MVKKQILEFALKNWKAILIVLLLVVIAMKSRRDYALMQKAYDTKVQSYEAQIEGLKEIHKQEIREKQILIESHLERIAAIEEEYEQALGTLEDTKEKKKDEYTKKFHTDKEQIIKDIEAKFGIKYAR